MKNGQRKRRSFFVKCCKPVGDAGVSGEAIFKFLDTFTENKPALLDDFANLFLNRFEQLRFNAVEFIEALGSHSLGKVS